MRLGDKMSGQTFSTHQRCARRASTKEGVSQRVKATTPKSHSIGVYRSKPDKTIIEVIDQQFPPGRK